MRELQRNLQNTIHSAIEAFEESSGMLVNEVRIVRGGCTDVPSYVIYGISILTSVNNYWKPKQPK